MSTRNRQSDLPSENKRFRAHNMQGNTTSLSIDRRSSVCRNGWAIFS
jgi:hypothetical protein